MPRRSSTASMKPAPSRSPEADPKVDPTALRDRRKALRAGSAHERSTIGRSLTGGRPSRVLAGPWPDLGRTLAGPRARHQRPSRWSEAYPRRDHRARQLGDISCRPRVRRLSSRYRRRADCRDWCGREDFEPPLVAQLAPQASASTNSATAARRGRSRRAQAKASSRCAYARQGLCPGRRQVGAPNVPEITPSRRHRGSDRACRHHCRAPRFRPRARRRRVRESPPDRSRSGFSWRAARSRRRKALPRG